MLFVQCQNGYVGWIFRQVSQSGKAAICTRDAFQILYDPSPSVAWETMVQALVAHSVSIAGAFVTTHWLQP